MKKLTKKRLFILPLMLVLFVFSAFNYSDSNSTNFTVANNTLYATNTYTTIKSNVDELDIIFRPYRNFTSWKSGVAFNVGLNTEYYKIDNTQSFKMIYSSSYIGNNSVNDFVKEIDFSNFTVRSSDTLLTIDNIRSSTDLYDYYFGLDNSNFVYDFLFTYNFSNCYQLNLNSQPSNFLTFGQPTTTYDYALSYSSDLATLFTCTVYNPNQTGNDTFDYVYNLYDFESTIYISHSIIPLKSVVTFNFPSGYNPVNNSVYYESRELVFNGVYDIRYVNSEGYIFDIMLPIYTLPTTTISTYDEYLSNYYDLTDSERYQLGYSEGYNSGINTSQTDSYNNGYNQGYNNGYTEGQNYGYNQGIQQPNSFTNLMFSVIDAPVKVFTSLLDFNILGINVSQFAISLLSMALIIAILRFIL